MFKKNNGPSGSLPITTSKALTRLKNEGQLAPWGRIDYTPIAIAPPKDLLVIDKEIEPTHWIFPEHSRLQAERQLALLGLSASELAKLAASPWKTTKQGVHVTPPEDLILDLVPEIRRKLYAYLAHFRQNTHANPLAFRRERLEDRLQRSGLNVLIIKSLRKLLYGEADYVFLADDRTLVSLAKDSEERLRLLTFLASEDTYAVGLRIQPDSDLVQLIHYWGSTGRVKDIEPIFRSLQMVPEGFLLDLAHLLPGVARRRIYTYPNPDQPLDDQKNCHWTSFNFHSDVADDRYIDVQFAQRELDAAYEQVAEPRFSDLVIFINKETSAVIHSAVYLADDLVFSKNGFGLLRPWIYTHVRSLVDLYSAHIGTPDAVKAILFRKRSDKN
jgi:hypothetical protein